MCSLNIFSTLTGISTPCSFNLSNPSSEMTEGARRILVEVGKPKTVNLRSTPESVWNMREYSGQVSSMTSGVSLISSSVLQHLFATVDAGVVDGSANVGGTTVDVQLRVVAG